MSPRSPLDPMAVPTPAHHGWAKNLPGVKSPPKSAQLPWHGSLIPKLCHGTDPRTLCDIKG